MRILRIIVRNRIGRRSARRRGYRSGNSRRIQIGRVNDNRERSRANRRRGWMDSKIGHKGRDRRGRSRNRRLGIILSRSRGRGGSSRRGRG